MAKNRCTGSNFVWGLCGVCVWLAGFFAGVYYATTPCGTTVVTHVPWGPVRRRYQVNFQGDLDDQ